MSRVHGLLRVPEFLRMREGDQAVVGPAVPPQTQHDSVAANPLVEGLPMRRIRWIRTAAVGLTLAVLGACSTEAAPAGTPSALASPSARSQGEAPMGASHSASASPSPSQAKPELTPAEGWIETASFGGDETIQAVYGVAEAPFGVIAAGVELSTRSLNVFGPLPGGGRVWLSADGTSWEDVTPADTFDGASINQLVVLSDATVLALGLAERLVDGFPAERPIAWETTDGKQWEEVPLTVGDDPVRAVAAGGPGYLALGGGELGGQQLWHSEDGRAFAPIADPGNGRIVTRIAAGPEGFVIVGEVYESAEPATLYASGNGIDWYTATSDGRDPWDVAPLGPDWIALDSPPFGLEEDVEVPTWFSGNGLDWNEGAPLPLRAIPVGGGAACGEYPGLVSSGRHVVASMTLSYPCGEGRVQHFGSAYITSDGRIWLPLPFVGDVDPADGSTRGTRVAAGLELESGTLLVGEKDYQATFWFRPTD